MHWRIARAKVSRVAHAIHRSEVVNGQAAQSVAAGACTLPLLARMGDTAHVCPALCNRASSSRREAQSATLSLRRSPRGSVHLPVAVLVVWIRTPGSEAEAQGEAIVR